MDRDRDEFKELASILGLWWPNKESIFYFPRARPLSRVLPRGSFPSNPFREIEYLMKICLNGNRGLHMIFPSLEPSTWMGYYLMVVFKCRLPRDWRWQGWREDGWVFLLRHKTNMSYSPNLMGGNPFDKLALSNLFVIIRVRWFTFAYLHLIYIYIV